MDSSCSFCCKMWNFKWKQFAVCELWCNFLKIESFLFLQHRLNPTEHSCCFFIFCRKMWSFHWRLDSQPFRSSLYKWELPFHWRSSELYEERPTRFRVSVLEVEATVLWAASIRCSKVPWADDEQVVGFNRWLHFTEPCAVYIVHACSGMYAY